MRIEQHISKKLGQWHVHLFMSEAEFKKQKKIRITSVVSLMDDLIIPHKVQTELLKLFHMGLLYLEVKKEDI